MPKPPPSHRYYRATHGAWSGAYRFEITRWAGFWETRMGLVDRLRVLSTVLTVKLLGDFTMETEMDYLSEGPSHARVTHHTRLLKWGLTFVRSLERFELDENGRDLRITGEQRYWPASWIARPLPPGSARVEESGERARYVLRVFETELIQQTEINEEGADIRQEAPWFRGHVMLRARSQR